MSAIYAVRIRGFCRVPRRIHHVGDAPRVSVGDCRRVVIVSCPRGASEVIGVERRLVINTSINVRPARRVPVPGSGVVIGCSAGSMSLLPPCARRDCVSHKSNPRLVVGQSHCPQAFMTNSAWWTTHDSSGCGAV